MQSVANYFAVSAHTALIRLTELGYVQPEFYWQQKRPQFVKAEKAI